MFKSLRERLSSWKQKAEAEVTSESIGDSGRKIKEDKLEEILYDLEIALLESDVAFPVAKEIVDRLAEDLRGKRISRDVSLARGRGRLARRDHRSVVGPAARLLRPHREEPAAVRRDVRRGQRDRQDHDDREARISHHEERLHLCRRGGRHVPGRRNRATRETRGGGGLQVDQAQRGRGPRRGGVRRGRARARPRPGRGPDRYGRPDADEPEPDGPDEEDQTRRQAEPDPLYRRRPRGQRCDRAGKAIPRIRRHRWDRPHEDRRGRQRWRGPLDGEDDRE